MAEVRPDEVSAILRKQLSGFENEMDVYDVGTVLQVGDGIARIYGLSKVMASELIEFPNNVFGMVLNLEEDNVGCVLFGESTLIKEGDTVKRTGRVASMPVGEKSSDVSLIRSASPSTNGAPYRPINTFHLNGRRSASSSASR
jgi:F-type H+/Na+-transporting ATPase subunit alpha